MSVMGKVRSLVRRFGAPAKFIIKTTLGTLIPGGGPVIDLIENLVDCAHESTKDNVESLASAEDLQRVEQILGIIEKDFDWVKFKVEKLEESLQQALAERQDIRQAAEQIRQSAQSCELLLKSQEKIANGVEALQVILPDIVGLRQFVDDFKAAGVSGDALSRDLREIKEALAELSRNKSAIAEPSLDRIAAKYPASAVSAKAVIVADVSLKHLDKAKAAVARATKLCPSNQELFVLEFRIDELLRSVRMFAITCPNCRNKFDVPESQEGQKVACPVCGQRLQIPRPPRNKTVLAQADEPRPYSAPPPVAVAAPPVPVLVAVPVDPVATRVVTPPALPPTSSRRRRNDEDFDDEDEHEDERKPRRKRRKGKARCHVCESTEEPEFREEISQAGWIVFALLLFFFFPLCWIGLLMKERIRVCYHCGTRFDWRNF